MRFNLLYMGIIAGFIGMSTPAHATLEETYDPGQPRAVTPWYGVAGESVRAADHWFISGMRPHHAGALTMSDDYLTDPAARNGRLKQLARGIIHNQKFEIGMLDTVEKHINSAEYIGNMQRIATEGLTQRERFFRAPVPGPLDAWAGDKTVSARDVQFAKAMIVHHQAALDMARDYLHNPDAKNGYLKQMCLDILLDQAQEIAFMNDVIADYPGNPDDVKIDASMVHGMEGMSHGSSHGASHSPSKGKKSHSGGHSGHH